MNVSASMKVVEIATGTTRSPLQQRSTLTPRMAASDDSIHFQEHAVPSKEDPGLDVSSSKAVGVPQPRLLLPVTDGMHDMSPSPTSSAGSSPFETSLNDFSDGVEADSVLLAALSADAVGREVLDDDPWAQVTLSVCVHTEEQSDVIDSEDDWEDWFRPKGGYTTATGALVAGTPVRPDGNKPKGTK